MQTQISSAAVPQCTNWVCTSRRCCLLT